MICDTCLAERSEAPGRAKLRRDGLAALVDAFIYRGFLLLVQGGVPPLPRLQRLAFLSLMLGL